MLFCFNVKHKIVLTEKDVSFSAQLIPFLSK